MTFFEVQHGCVPPDYDEFQTLVSTQDDLTANNLTVEFGDGQGWYDLDHDYVQTKVQEIASACVIWNPKTMVLSPSKVKRV